MLSPRIETDRLILRRYNESDIDAMYEIITDNRVENLQWMTLEDNLKHAMEVGSLGRDELGRFVNTSN